MRVLVAEDEELYAEMLQLLLEQMNYDAIQIVNNSDTLFEIMPLFKPDLLLLDIHLPGSLDGIEIAQKIQEVNPFIPIIFVTSFSDNATYERAKATVPYAFLNKPFDEKVLARTIDLAFQQYQVLAKLQPNIQIPDGIFIKVDNVLHKIVFKNVIYIESDDHYLSIVTMNKKYFIRYMLSKMMEKLPKELFLQVSRSCVVNKSHIKEVYLTNNELLLSNQRKLDFSKRVKSELLRFLEE